MKNLYFKCQTAKKLIKKHNGKFITFVFVKRTDGKMRVMNCKVCSDQKDDNKLFLVSELKGLRSIPQDRILEIRANGRIYRPKDNSYQSMAVN